MNPTFPPMIPTRIEGEISLGEWVGDWVRELRFGFLREDVHCDIRLPMPNPALQPTATRAYARVSAAELIRYAYLLF